MSIIEPIVPTAAAELVYAAFAEQQVDTPIPEQTIIARATNEYVIAIKADDQVISSKPLEHVRPVCAEDYLIRCILSRTVRHTVFIETLSKDATARTILFLRLPSDNKPAILRGCQPGYNKTPIGKSGDRSCILKFTGVGCIDQKRITLFRPGAIIASCKQAKCPVVLQWPPAVLRNNKATIGQGADHSRKQGSTVTSVSRKSGPEPYHRHHSVCHKIACPIQSC